jgi:hypothetical protein
MEHRWGHRIEVVIPVRLHASSRLRGHSAQLANLSRSGGWIPLDVSVRRLSRIQVVFDLPLSCSGPRRVHASPPAVNAYVARHSGDGIGLEWCEHAPELVVRLLQDLAQRQHMRPAGDMRDVDRDPPGFHSCLTVV